MADMQLASNIISRHNQLAYNEGKIKARHLVVKRHISNTLNAIFLQSNNFNSIISVDRIPSGSISVFRYRDHITDGFRENSIYRGRPFRL